MAAIGLVCLSCMSVKCFGDPSTDCSTLLCSYNLFSSASWGAEESKLKSLSWLSAQSTGAWSVHLSCILSSCVCLSWPEAWTLSRPPREGQHCWRCSLATVVKPSQLLLHCLLSGMPVCFPCQSDPPECKKPWSLVTHMANSADWTTVLTYLRSPALVWVLSKLVF